MTDVRTTQVPVEQWYSTSPDARTTQVVVEEWASVADAPPVVPGTDNVRVMVLA